MKEYRYFKVFEVRDDQPLFLYHGLRGARLLPVGVWLEAERKWVSEGSNPFYWSGFHVYPDLDAVTRWIHKARHLDKRTCVMVTVRLVRKKPTAGDAYLAKWLCLSQQQWRQRIPLADLSDK